MKPIPAIWRIDVEPDDIQPGHGLPPWNGFVDTARLVERLRAPLAELSGAPVNPSWFLRLDPDVERCYGRADFVAQEYGSIIDTLRARGDSLGIHVHFFRWDQERQASYSDHADESWATHCVDVAVEMFERCFGERPRRSSQGGFFLAESLVNHAITAGVEVDVTAEPGLKPVDADKSFGAYSTAPTPDFANYPRYPYYPTRADLGVPAASSGDSRRMLIVPLTAYDYYRRWAAWHIRAVKFILRWPSRHLPLNPWKQWPSPHEYWDLMERAADEGPARYIAFAVRTDGPGSVTSERQRILFEYLPKHPIARRLRFVDPLSPEIRALANSQTQGWS